MKRSEIIKKIQSLYELELVNYPKENPSDIFAENLLCHLEHAGMRPTESERFGGHYEIRRVTNWEPEE